MVSTDGPIGMLTGTSIMDRIHRCHTGMTGGGKRMAILPAETLSLFMVRGNQNDGPKMTISDVSSREVSLHDAEIVSVSMDRGTSVYRFGLSRVAGRCCAVELFGVRAFRAKDFVLQNVVSRMLRSSVEQFSSEAIEYWVTWVTGFSDTDSWLKPDSKHRWLASLNEGKVELVVFEPSLGAQIAAICERLLFVHARPKSRGLIASSATTEGRNAALGISAFEGWATGGRLRAGKLADATTPTDCPDSGCFCLIRKAVWMASDARR